MVIGNNVIIHLVSIIQLAGTFECVEAGFESQISHLFNINRKFLTIRLLDKKNIQIKN